MSPSPPVQQRSRQTLEAVLVAATELFARSGEKEFTLPQVAKRAGVSVGTVYRRFATKEDLLAAVFDRLRQAERNNVTARWEAIDWASMPIRDMTDCLVADISRIWHEQESFMRAMMLRHLKMVDGDRAFDHGVEAMRESMQRFTRVILGCGRPVVHPDPRRACEFAYRMIVGMAARLTARAIETQAPAEVSWGELTDELGDAVARYLFGPDYAAL